MNATPPDSHETKRDVLTIGVVGGGTMGKGIAQLFFRAGHRVRVFDQSEGLVGQWLDALPSSDRQADNGSGEIAASPSLAALAAGADLIVEAVTEERDVKNAVFKELSLHASDACVIATNTSSFPIDELAEDCTLPTRFLGIHFFNPADLIPGVEVIPGEATTPETVAQVLRWLTEAGKRPATVSSSPGFIANRLQMALFLECLRCVDEGLVTPEDLDTVVSTTFGFRLPLFGPFAIADMAGLDVYKSILETLEEGYGERFAPPEALLARTSRGEVGVKAGKGFATYDAKERAELITYRDEMYGRLREVLQDGGTQFP